MRKIMIRRSFLFISVIMVLSTTGCIKETYDMKKLSKKAHLTPTMAISAIKGDISLSDIVKSNDTVVFDQNNFVKIIFKKDSVLDLKMADFYDLNNMVSFSQAYTLGNLSLAPFQATVGYTLNQIIALNDGSPHPFPAFGSTDLGEKTFSFTNFENAVFKSGFLDISIKNNLNASLYSITMNLYNTGGHTTIVSGVTIPPISAGQTGTYSIDLTDKAVTNSIIAAIVLSGSPGNSTPVLIGLNNSNIQVTIQGRDMKVKSGRVILPTQTISSLDNKDTITVNLGSGVELDELKITTGNLSYHILKQSTLTISLTISMPSALSGVTPVSKLINIGTGSQFDGSISFDNTIVDLGTDPLQPFNRVPLEYSISVSSTGMVNFNATDEIRLDLKLLNPVFDYVKGYFGQKIETIDPDTLNLEIEDILSHITGTFRISSPSIKINYSNSFAIPIQITFNATGKRKAETVNLGLMPFTLTYPVAPANRDVSASYAINNSNSLLSELISMPPEEIRFSGTAKMNPSGNDGQRNNYVFGNSRFLGSLEVEVPMEFRINNLQFTDTLDNFLDDEGSSDNPVKPENFELLRVDINAKNGFPLGVSLKMSLYDSMTNKIKSSVNATGILEPAPVDINGRVKPGEVTETSTSIEFTKEFFSSINKADKIIFQFTLNTTGNGSKDVKIYSDYRIDFNAALVVKPDINLK
jgi:hypothetical protein